MGKNKEKTNKNPDIDLLNLFGRIADLFGYLKQLLFGIIRFFVKNSRLVVALIALGVGLGILIDKLIVRYEQKIVVAPNFDSAEYLYSKIDFLVYKIGIQDTLFLKSIGIENPSTIVSIAIEPIVDVNNLMNTEGKNTELLQLMAQNGDLNPILKLSSTNSKFEFHNIIMETKGLVSDKSTIEPLLKYLNASNYYKNINRINAQNISHSIKEKQKTIFQIDSILKQFSPLYGRHASSDKLVYYNENLNLDRVIQLKDSLVKQINSLKEEQYNSSSTIKERGMVLNSRNPKSIKGKLVYILPLLFVGLFAFMRLLISFYKSQETKLKSKQPARL